MSIIAFHIADAALTIAQKVNNNCFAKHTIGALAAKVASVIATKSFVLGVPKNPDLNQRFGGIILKVDLLNEVNKK